jgi:TRAP-type transport system periplasmic protein
MQVNEISAEEHSRMVEKAQTVYEKHAATIGPEVVERIQAELKKLRGN